jgi:hypothetical protein
MCAYKKLLLTALSLFACSNTYAGGPLAVDGNTPVHYSPATVTLNFDIGMLGSRTNAQADSLVLQGLALWNNVATSSIILTQGNDLPVDVDGSNYATYIPDKAQDNPAVNNDNLNPVVYDSDGSIIDDLFGAGQSDYIAGLAASSYIPGTGLYKEGFMVLNGKMTLPPISESDSDIVNEVAHEMGHFIGLDHSQLNIDNTETYSGTNPTACTTTTQDKYPLMYPILCRLENTLHVDDVAAVSTLYPSSDINSHFGQINGIFVDTSGQPILGANIWVKNTLTGDAYSVVSDYLLQNTGYFSIYLPPGDYTLHADAINPIFYGASSVGPYAYTQTDPSFTSPNPITAVNYEGSTPGATQTISITPNEAVHVKFVVDGSGATSPGTIINSVATINSFAPPSSWGSSGALSPEVLLLLAAGVFYLRREQAQS